MPPDAAGTSTRRPPKVEPLFTAMTDRLLDARANPPPRLRLLVGVALLVTTMMFISAWGVLYFGVGVWGVNIPVAWGFAIVNFVWWIGIGHAGTLISAILLLLKQGWRNSINRFAEAMTLFAVMNAGLFPLLHLGRYWRFYWLFPYPSTMGVWPQWRSPLVWDFFAVSTYATVSLLFWYVGLIPDLASLRDSSPRRLTRVLAGIFALGWRGSDTQWAHHQSLYLILAGLATPLVISVHSIVSMDFAVAIVPGWHSTIFPPYFVAGAIFSGFAMVITLAVPLRAAYRLKDLISVRHLDLMGKVMLVSGLIVAYGYLMEEFAAFAGHDRFERYVSLNRLFGPYWPVTWLTLLCNVIVAQSLWFPRVRRSPLLLFIVAQFINVGMWTERSMIVITSLHRDYMPSAWGMFRATPWDWSLLVGTLGFFLLLFIIFLRLTPFIPIYEMREQIHEELEHRGEHEPRRHAEPERCPQPCANADLHGVCAEFDSPRPLLDACRALRDAGYTATDAYTPLPLKQLRAALGKRPSRVPGIMLGAGLVGGAGAFAFQGYIASVNSPWNIGGRPTFSWPSFVPITFELIVLTASLVGALAFVVLNRFPQLHHSISNLDGFERATRDRFFLCVRRDDPLYDRVRTPRLLAELDPIAVGEVRR